MPELSVPAFVCSGLYCTPVPFEQGSVYIGVLPAINNLAIVQQTNNPELRLPKSLLEKAIMRGNEFGWRQTDFLEVVEAARKQKLAIIGGQVQYVLPEGTCELYWLSYDPATRQPNENWLNYCNRMASETINKFNLLISQTNIEKEAISNFELLKRKSESGVNINEYLIFILYFDDSETEY